MCGSTRIGSIGPATALETLQCDYVGGKVLPLWGAPRPEWIPDHGGRQWAVIALLDYGPEPIPFFTQAHRVPLGVNMAFRREAFDRAGPVGQQRRPQEGHAARAGSARVDVPRARRGPSRLVRAVDGRPARDPGDRLNKRYFRRWYYWNGVSRALLYRDAWIDMQAPESTDVDFSRVPHILACRASSIARRRAKLRRLLLSALAR